MVLSRREPGRDTDPVCFGGKESHTYIQILAELGIESGTFRQEVKDLTNCINQAAKSFSNVLYSRMIAKETKRYKFAKFINYHSENKKKIKLSARSCVFDVDFMFSLNRES